MATTAKEPVRMLTVKSNCPQTTFQTKQQHNIFWPQRWKCVHTTHSVDTVAESASLCTRFLGALCAFVYRASAPKKRTGVVGMLCSSAARPFPRCTPEDTRSSCLSFLPAPRFHSPITVSLCVQRHSAMPAFFVHFFFFSTINAVYAFVCVCVLGRIWLEL